MKVFKWRPEITLFRIGGTGFVYKFLRCDHEFLYYSNGWESKREDQIKKIPLDQILSNPGFYREWNPYERH